MILEINFNTDVAGKKITVSRDYTAPVEKVWRCWTEKELLDQWWAPRPWKSKTKTMEFRVGGLWLYAMVGPGGEKHWARADYLGIEPYKCFSLQDSFCDENGVINNRLPGLHWTIQFSPVSAGTRVAAEINFSSGQDLKTILEMGFQEGFTAGLNNLEELLEKG